MTTTHRDIADVRRTRTLVIWLASVAWLVLVFFAVATTRGPIESDLSTKSQQALAAAGMEKVRVEFEGRDATLIGAATSRSEADSAAAVVLAVEGVRAVENHLEVDGTPSVAPPLTTDPTTPPVQGTEPPSFVMLVSGGTVALTGSVPTDEIRDALVAGAVRAFGLEHVVSTISVSPQTASAPWLEALPFMLGQMGDVTEFSLVVAGGTAELSGLAVTEAASQSIESLVALSLPGLEVVNLLEVGADEHELVQGKLDGLDLTRVTFSVGSTDLEPAGLSVLATVVAILGDHPDVVIEIGGHTDATGSEDKNVELSQGRAEAVLEYLVDGGVARERMTAVGYGSQHPVGDNFTEAGRAANRRIEIVVVS